MTAVTQSKDMSQLSRRKVIGGSLATTLGLAAGNTSTKAAAAGPEDASDDPPLRSKGGEPMSLREFQALNGPGAVSRLMGQMECETLSGCHRDMKKKHGIWIPELVPFFEEIDARSLPQKG